jgi:hypothetical protein
MSSKGEYTIKLFLATYIQSNLKHMESKTYGYLLADCSFLNYSRFERFLFFNINFCLPRSKVIIYVVAQSRPLTVEYRNTFHARNNIFRL